MWKPWAEVAAEGAEPQQGERVLDALGHHLEAEVVAEVDDRADDREVVGAGGHAARRTSGRS